MMFITHLLFGILLASFFSKLFHIENPIFFGIVISFFAIFPDIDEPSSKIGRKTQPFSWAFKILFSHRGIFHSIYFAALSFVLVGLIDRELGLAAGLGYGSHLLLDAVTKKGIKPFTPLLNFKIKGVITNKSFAETAIMAVLSVLILYQAVT